MADSKKPPKSRRLSTQTSVRMYGAVRLVDRLLAGVEILNTLALIRERVARRCRKCLPTAILTIIFGRRRVGGAELGRRDEPSPTSAGVRVEPKDPDAC